MRVAVAGAGIAGLTSALALAGSGHDVTLYERRTGFGESGAGIQLSPNATHVLLGLGLGPALARIGCEPDRIVIRSLRTGRDLGAVALGAWMRERFGAPYLAVARSDLHTVLLDAVRSRPNILIRVGRGLVDAVERGTGIEIATETAGGAGAVAAADLLIGADGLWSRTRATLGDARLPGYSGYAAYRATVPAERWPAGFCTSETGLWLGVDRHVVHYSIAGGRTMNLVVVVRRRDPVEGWSSAEERGPVLATLRDAPDRLRALAAAAETWSGWSLHELPARVMAQGRVALVGDAAHPVLPYLAQGGSLAIEDAAALAALLGDDPGHVPEALRQYGRARLSRVRKVQRTARRNGAVYHASFPLAFARDFVMGRLGPDGMGERYGWLYGWRAPAATT